MTESVGFGDAPVPARPHVRHDAEPHDRDTPVRHDADRHAHPEHAHPEHGHPEHGHQNHTEHDPALNEIPGDARCGDVRATPRVSVRFTLQGERSPAAERRRPTPGEPGWWPALGTWALLVAGAGLSGVVAVVMLTAWSEMLVRAASSSELMLVGGEHGLLVLAGAFLVLVAAMAKIWTLGAVVGRLRAAPTLLVTMLALDLAVWAVGELSGGVGTLWCTAVVVLDVLVIVLLRLTGRAHTS